MANPLHVIISGAGLAGPALAIALAKQSIRSTILERRPYSQDIGGVIMLAPNALHALPHIRDRLRTLGDTFKAIDLYTKGSTTLDKIGGFMVEDKGVQGLTIARPVLHRELLRQCEEMSDMIEIRYSAELESIEEDEKGCSAILKGGDVVRGEYLIPDTTLQANVVADILVGADGIRSKARKHILGENDITPRYAGYFSIGCILPKSSANLPPDMTLPAFLYTPSGTFLIFAMDNTNDKIQWATSINTPERDRRHGWDELRTSGEALQMLKDEYKDVTMEPIRTFVDALSNDNLRLWAPYEVPQIPNWHTDRVCIVGDAAHAISPSVGQGSAQAFEDIAFLARLLSSPTAVAKGFPALFAYFEKVRRPRVKSIQAASAKAEGGRGKSGTIKWIIKSWGMWAGLNIFGKGGYIKGDLFSYNVMEEKIKM
jgi:2-polyprenyl-6-methoxyphenol hydroxylase-like FAD-dependent oxidoreductase